MLAGGYHFSTDLFHPAPWNKESAPESAVRRLLRVLAAGPAGRQASPCSPSRASIKKSIPGLAAGAAGEANVEAEGGI